MDGSFTGFCISLLEARTSGVLVSTIIMSGLVAVALLGNYNYFGHIKTMGISHSMIIPVLVSAVSCGILGGAFSRMMLLPVMYKSAALWKWRARHPVVFAGICGALVAAIGLASGGTSFGSGYAITSQIVAGRIEAPWYAPIMRFLATIASYYSGIPGGIFAPSLAIGAALGSNVATAVGITASTISIIALCMAGFLAAVTQAPITAAIIVMEMTDGHSMVISLMAVALFAKAISSRISPELYQHLALDFRPKDERA